MYRIKPEAFARLRDQIVELFPTENGELFYVPYYRSKSDSTTLSARGCLYNTYKFIRNQLRAAGILTVEEEEEKDDVQGTHKNKNTSFHHLIIMCLQLNV